MNNGAFDNPWTKLPKASPFILPMDRDAINAHRHASNEFRFDTLPEPYVGGLNRAEIVFLALNPGFRNSDIAVNMASSTFREANQRNQANPYDSLFYYFSGGFEETGGYWWWKEKLMPLIEQGATETDICNKIMLIEYLPYHSPNAKRIANVRVPSQDFSFELVREAIRRYKLIVMMRSEKLWSKAVPELEGRYIMPHSSQNVIVSPNNMGQRNFNRILGRLTK